MTGTVDITAVSKLKHSDLWDAAKKHGSQAALARVLGIEQTRLGRWINLQEVPSPRYLALHGDDLDAKLYMATGKGLDELFPDALRDAKSFLGANKTIEQRATLTQVALENYADTTARRLEYKFPDVDADSLRDDVHEVMRDLTERERRALTLRFGLDGNGPRTYSEMSKEMGVARERCRQLEHNGIRELRHVNSARRLVGYLPD